MKPKIKKNKKAIISILLIVAILVTGAFAFLSATDSKTNVFTVGKVNIKLHENFDTDLDGVAERDPESTVVTEEIVPGQTILKQPYVENTGKNEAWIFVSVGIPTATEDDIYKDDNQNINIEGRTLSMDVKAYAIQTGFTGNANETAKAVWEKYVENKQTELFGDEFTGDKTTRIQLFKTMIQSGDTFSEGYNDTNWDKITNAYMSTNDHDYYVYAYKTTLAAPTNGNSPVTENVFDAVKLIEDIGEGKPKRLNYFAPDNAVDLTDFNLDDCSLVKSETFAAGDALSELYFDDSLSHDGYSFDWLDAYSGSTAFSGMILEDDTDLIANYDSRISPSDTLVDQGVVRYSLIVYNGELALRTYDTYSDTPDAYKNSTLSLPSTITFTTGDESLGSSQLLSATATNGGIVLYNLMDMKYNKDLTWQVALKNGQFGDAAISTNDNPYVPLKPNTTYTLPLRVVGHEITKVPFNKLIISDTVKRLFTKKGNTEINMSSDLTEVYLPYGLQSLDSSVFANSNLKTLELPNTITSIGAAFKNTYIESLIIPKSVSWIASEAFVRASNTQNNYISCTKNLNVTCNLDLDNNSNGLLIPNGVETLVLSNCHESKGRSRLLSRNYATGRGAGIRLNSNTLKSVGITGSVDLVQLDSGYSYGIEFNGSGKIGLLLVTTPIDINIQCGVTELYNHKTINKEYECTITDKVEKIFTDQSSGVGGKCNYIYEGNVESILNHFYIYKELPEFSESDSIIPCYVDPSTTTSQWYMCKINSTWYCSGWHK